MQHQTLQLMVSRTVAVANAIDQDQNTPYCGRVRTTVVVAANSRLPVYIQHGVPVTLATDDEGVSRTDMTHEYLRAVATYDLPYAELKRMPRPSPRAQRPFGL